MRAICYILFFQIIAINLFAQKTSIATEKGVSLVLANDRKATYHDVSYSLLFVIPENKSDGVTGNVQIRLKLDEPAPIILDFTAQPQNNQTIWANGKQASYEWKNEHIVIPSHYFKKGLNTIQLSFQPTDHSLNRRDDFLYTLLVPDRARTLFPCFDQPNLKARFTLALEIPENWEAVANGAILQTTKAEKAGRKTVFFRETEPISTYLFSFVSGRFEQISESRNGREITLYYRDTDPQKVKQCGQILDEVFHSLQWMENYTSVPYPFEKYDLISIPGFQYGGMEHMGATLYAENRLFLEPNATLNDSLERSELIAHETAHMWFGDFVTMEWFNDVWNKEVFANYFASQIVRPLYPDINHQLNFVRSNVPAAYAEDRSGGAMPIQQKLDNLSDAGLIYSNVVYCKSPIVMAMLVDQVGEELFQKGIRKYLQTYRYGNSNWDKLINLLDDLSEEDLAVWSHAWVKEKGMPTITCRLADGILTMNQVDCWGRGLVWDQPITISSMGSLGIINNQTIRLDQEKITYPVDAETIRVLLNTDGKSYGYFELDDQTAGWMLEKLSTIKDDLTRYSLLIQLYENVLNKKISPQDFVNAVITIIPGEKNLQVLKQALDYAESCVRMFLREDQKTITRLETQLLDLAHNDPDTQKQTLAIQAFLRIASTPEGLAKLYTLWDDEAQAQAQKLSETELIALSYELAIRFPEKAAEITSRQRARIINPDRIRQYQYISPAVSADKEVRDSVFQSLLQVQNREVEPWAAQALGLLNHPLRQASALEYICPGLETLQEIQQTGDIFFPRSWCQSLLRGHQSKEALQIVERFLKDHPHYPPLLESKIRQQADHLYIIAGNQHQRYQSTWKE